MTDPPQQFKRHAHRTIDRWGEPAVLTTYTHDGTFDEYGDPVFTETETPIDAYFDETFGGRDRADGSGGSEMLVEVEVWIKDTDSAIDQPTSTDPERNARLTRTNAGVEYTLRYLSRHGNGLLYAVGMVTQ